MTGSFRHGIGATLIVAILIGGTGAAAAAGALAVGRCAAYGYAFDSGTMQEAQTRAVSACKGPGCRIVATVQRQCAALAIDARNACGAHGWATARTLGRAQNVATQQCHRHGGRDCVIRAWLCDGRG
jgi:uncharacterized protein DUF4189